MFNIDFPETIQISIAGQNTPINVIPWTPHASFKGVALKHLAKGSQTGGLASFHLVKVEPGCALLSHTHPGKCELHEVIMGSGTATIDGRSIIYRSGQMALIPADATHSVTAGKDGLLIMAKFFPALI